MSIYKRIPSDLSIILIWIIFTFIVTLIYENSILRIIMGIPTVLFIPGYVLVAALFPKRDDLYGVERMALSLIMSIVVVSLLGLLLNFTLGIDLVPIVVTLCLLEIITIFIAIYRRERLSVDEKFSISFHKIYENMISGLHPKTKTDGLLTMILIFSLVVLAGTIYFSFTTPKIGEKFTEFYVLNSSARTDNFLTNLKVDHSYDYLIGIVNYEHEPIDYTVEVVLDKNVLASDNLTLNYEETWENNVTFVPDKEGTNMQLEFWLFRNNDFKEPYRKLYLWVNSTR